MWARFGEGAESRGDRYARIRDVGGVFAQRGHSARTVRAQRQLLR